MEFHPDRELLSKREKEKKMEMQMEMETMLMKMEKYMMENGLITSL